MSTLVVAKKDFRDAVRSKSLWVLIALFVLFIPVVALYTVVSGSNADDGIPTGLVFSTGLVMVFLAPVTALFVSIKSIVRERTFGTIKVLLSLPHTRGEVFFGKLLGRLAVFTVAVLVGYVPALVILSLGHSGFEPLEFVVTVVAVLYLGSFFLLVGLCASTLTRSESVATAAGFAIYFFIYYWSAIFSLLNNRLGLVDGHAETFISRFELTTIGEDITTMLLWLRGRESDMTSAAVSGGGDVPFYLQHWFAVVPLLVWIGVPLVIGYWRFNRIEL